jgi:FAD-linked sulfhydryl oxidase
MLTQQPAIVQTKLDHTTEHEHIKEQEQQQQKTEFSTTKDSEHFLEQMKSQKSCGVCSDPSTMKEIQSLITPNDNGIYGLPRKRKVIKPKPYSKCKYSYTSTAVLPTGYHLGNYTDFKTFGSARRYIINRQNGISKDKVPHASYISRYSPDQLEAMRVYYDHPEYEETEIDYRIPSDPQQRELEFGTATENHVKIMLHNDGSISPLHCPTTYQQLSQGTWVYLHTMAAYYPEQPTPEFQQSTSQFMTHFPHLYPCEHCKTHMIDYLIRQPLQLSSNRTFSIWMCEYHNEVNAYLGKRIVNCDPEYLLERYKDGYHPSLNVDCSH